MTATGRKQLDHVINAARRCLSAMAGSAARLTPALLSCAAPLALLTANPSDDGGFGEVMEFAAAEPTSVRDRQSAFRRRSVAAPSRSAPDATSRSRGSAARSRAPASATPVRTALLVAKSDVGGSKPSNIYTARFFSKDPGPLFRFLTVPFCLQYCREPELLRSLNPKCEHDVSGADNGVGRLGSYLTSYSS